MNIIPDIGRLQTNENLRLESATFEEIFPIWREELWRERKSEIRPISSMCLLGGYNLSLHMEAQPSFLVVRADNEIVAVNSGHSCLVNYRSRGLWVHPRFRRRGLGQILLNATEHIALRSGFREIWSFPRRSALAVYEKAGYVKVSDWIVGEPPGVINCFVAKLIVGPSIGGSI